MATTIFSQPIIRMSTTAPKEAIVEALEHLPPEYFPEVLHFIQFLEYKYTTHADELAEDETLWEAVQAHQTYKARHPEEPPECYESGAEFLKSVENL